MGYSLNQIRFSYQITVAKALTVVLVFVLSSPAIVAETLSSDAIDARLRESGVLSDQVPIVAVEKAPIEGFWAVFFASGEMFYTNDEASILVGPNLLQLIPGVGIADISTQQMNTFRKSLVFEQDHETIDFPPAGGTEHVVYVFSDVSCGYCQKLHEELDEYHDRGIELRYFLWARAGEGSEPYNSMVSAWCAEDRNRSFTLLKRRRSITETSCENPLEEHMKLVRTLGLTGTPAMILESGGLVGGYVPAAELEARILAQSI